MFTSSSVFDFCYIVRNWPILLIIVYHSCKFTNRFKKGPVFPKIPVYTHPQRHYITTDSSQHRGTELISLPHNLTLCTSWTMHAFENRITHTTLYMMRFVPQSSTVLLPVSLLTPLERRWTVRNDALHVFAKKVSGVHIYCTHDLQYHFELLLHTYYRSAYVLYCA